MSEVTKIEWADSTFNPWLGCTKVSPACTNCYAEGWAKRSGLVQWGDRAERRRTTEAYWQQPLKWNRQAASSGKVFRVFGGSLCDWLDDRVPIAWLADYLALIWRCQNLQWLLLTKRIESFRIRLELAAHHLAEWGQKDTAGDVLAWLDGAVPPFIALGVTAENQKYADERIPLLLQTPAGIRFISAEPLLGPINLPLAYCNNCFKFVGFRLVNNDKDYGCVKCGCYLNSMSPANRPGSFYQVAPLHWVIVGGESAPRARPMHPDWARSLQRQCEAAGVSYFHKQNGEFAQVSKADASHRLESDGTLFTKRDAPEGSYLDTAWLKRVGKKAAGRLLDGREYSEFPEVSQCPAT
ncbi:MAG TPA: phage Gp37/Gp68 family protein [Candidatus Sulfotelmatobacter sp.]|nr:phage Gp37/Gp68 family protein [Candidatus Sulfotelmatobacter sp.]